MQEYPWGYEFNCQVGLLHFQRAGHRVVALLGCAPPVVVFPTTETKNAEHQADMPGRAVRTTSSPF